MVLKFESNQHTSEQMIVHSAFKIQWNLFSVLLTFTDIFRSGDIFLEGGRKYSNSLHSLVAG